MKQLGIFISKEWRHILRDRHTLVMLFAIPVMLVMLFGYVISTEIDHTPIAVVDNTAGDPLVRKALAKLTAAGKFNVVEYLDSDNDIESAFKRGQVKMVVVFPPRFGSELRHSGKATLQLLADATDLNIATTITSYATQIITILSAEQSAHQGVITKPPLELNVRMSYNPALRSVYMFIPGVIAMIVTIMSAMMTSVTLAGEKERGTMRLLTISPLNPATIILGKVIPYLLLSVASTALIMAIGVYLFEMPIKGSIWLLSLLCLLFILTALSLGIFISSLAGNQQSALMASFLGLYLPTVLLSGFVFPIETMPIVLQWITHLIPATWFIEGLKSIMIKGVGIEYLLWPIGMLSGISTLLLSIALVRSRNRPT